MPSALDKLIALSAPAAEPAVLNPADELVLAAQALADELHVLLADDDDDDDSGGGGKSSGKSGGNSKSDDGDDDDNEYAQMVAKLVKKGVPEARAKQMAKQAMKRVAATALAEGISVALSELSVPAGVTLADVRNRMQRAFIPGLPSLMGLTSAEDTQTVRLAVLSTAERKKPSAHTIPGTTDFPIPDKGHLTAAVARYHQGALAGHPKEVVRKHILAAASRLGEQVDLVGE